MTDKSESRIPGINVQVTNELQTLYSDQINLSNKEIKTKKIDNFSTAPIGLFGYAFCCYIVGLGKLGIIEFDSVNSGVALCFGGLCQYVIGIYDWYRGFSLNAFLDVGFAMFNMGLTFWDIFAAQEVAPFPVNKVRGYFYSLWTIIEIFILIASYPGGKVSFVNNIFVFISFILQGFEFFFDSTILGRIAGGGLLVVATFMMYITFAILINSTYKRTLLPLFEKGETIECKISLKVKNDH